MTVGNGKKILFPELFVAIAFIDFFSFLFWAYTFRLSI